MQSVIDDTKPPGNAIISHAEGVDLIPSNIELSGMEVGLFNVMSREFVLKECIAPLRKNYDYILIDCMPSLGMMTINALVAADSVIIPSQPNFLSTKGLNLLLRSISKIKRQINPRLRIDGILLTMVDSRTNNAKEIIASLRSTVGEKIRVLRSSCALLLSSVPQRRRLPRLRPAPRIWSRIPVTGTQIRCTARTLGDIPPKTI